MTTLHIGRGDTNLGAFTVEEVEEGLRTGRFLPTDLAWETGMAGWLPLAQVMAAKSAGSIAPLAPPLPVSIEPISRSGLPWEHRDQLGLFKAFCDTVGLVFTRPSVAFAMMKPEGDMMGPLLFALIGGSIGMFVAYLIQMGVDSAGFMTNRQTSLYGMGHPGLWALSCIIFIPLSLVLGTFIVSALLHLCLMLLGGAKKTFETTFRVVCFSCGSTYLLLVIPFCGGIIGGVWNIVLQCIGLARAHETDTGTAAMAVLLPIILCCGCAILVSVLFTFSLMTLFKP
ncbi:MAG: hypothetical protein QOH88_1090 [Verrucomicrobiota bacterium]|jgi:hypothetical protein